MTSIIFKRSNRKFILKCNSKRFNNFENHQIVYEKNDLISKTIKEYYSCETFPTTHWKTCFRRWADEGISSFSLHPGLVCTEIFDKADFTSYKESDHSINLHNLQAFLSLLEKTFDRNTVKSIIVRHCLKQNFLSNPRRIHSKEEDEEKEE